MKLQNSDDYLFIYLFKLLFLFILVWVEKQVKQHRAADIKPLLSNPWQHLIQFHISTLCKLGLKLTLFGHSHSKALLQAAVLTAVPRHLVDNAVLVPVTRVHHVLLDASAEKTLRKQTERRGGSWKEDSHEVNLIFLLIFCSRLFSKTSTQLHLNSPATGYHNVTTACVTMCSMFCLFIAIKAERKKGAGVSLLGALWSFKCWI